MSTNAATISTDEIYVGENTSFPLNEYLEAIESDISDKAASNHSHADLESAIEGLEDGKAEAVHTHEMSAIVGLNAALTEMEEAIAAIQNGSSTGVAPMLVASMHLGKLDNNSGAENTSSTRICSDPFAVEPGKTYWQVNEKGVNMYVLIYDAEETFLAYMGSFASGAEIAVTNENAAYMRIGSLLGEYDLTNEFRIYNVDPDSGGHTHTPEEVGALPVTGGTIDGDLVVTGNGTIRGKAYTQQILPMDAGSYSIGSADNRYYSTYLRANPNVSSDKRLKRDIAVLDAGTLAEFVNALPVVAYNYNDDAEDEAQRIGLIAQDVISADPAIAAFFVEQSEKGFYSLRPADFVFPLIAAVQYLSVRVAELERKV